MTLFTTIDDRIELMPFFLSYYARIGITQFVIGMWNGTDNPAYKELNANLGYWTPSGCTSQIQESVRCSYDEYCGPAEVEWSNKARLEMLEPEEWYATSDLDEFVTFGRGNSYQAMQQIALETGCHTVAGANGASFVDRVAIHGFPPIPKWGEATLDETFPYACDLTRAMGCGTSKTVMARADVTILSGHHYTFGHPVLENSAEVHHFKWNANMPHLLTRRHLAFHKQGLQHAPESMKFMEFFMLNPDWRSNPALNLRIADKLGI